MINRLRKLLGLPLYPVLSRNDPWPDDNPNIDTTGVLASFGMSDCVVRARYNNDQPVVIHRQIESWAHYDWQSVYIARSPYDDGYNPVNTCIKAYRERHGYGRGADLQWAYGAWKFEVVNGSHVVRTVKRRDWFKFEAHMQLPVVTLKSQNQPGR